MYRNALFVLYPDRDYERRAAHSPAATPLSSIGEDSACHSLYVGPPNGSPLRAAFWTQGIPRPTEVACFPSEAANLADTWPGIVRILEPMGAVAGVPASVIASIPNPPNPTDVGGCCLGSSCIVTDYFDCMVQDGYFRSDVFDCSIFNPCISGACCVSDSTSIRTRVLTAPIGRAFCWLTPNRGFRRFPTHAQFRRFRIGLWSPCLLHYL